MAKNNTKNKSSLIPAKYHDLIFIIALILSVYIFLFKPITQGGFEASDNLASVSFENYLDQAKEDGEFPLWIPHIFSGMPGYASLMITGDRWWDIFASIFFGFAMMLKHLFGSDTARVAFYFAMYGVGMYLLLRSKDINKVVSFITSFAAVFSTSVIIWIMIGHNTKPIVLACLPFVFLFVEKLREKFSLLHSVLLILILHIAFEATHIQMIFYAASALGLYLLFEIVSRLITKQDFRGSLRSIAILVLAGGLSFVMSSDRFLPVLEYTDYSTRGTAPILSDKDDAKDNSGGNTYDYATMWSFSPAEISTFFVPNYYGFGKLPYDVQTNRNRILSRVAEQQPGKMLNTYWSQKPFEDAAPYMGIIILIFGIIGILLNRKNLFVVFLAVLSLFSLLLSFGSTFPILYDFFFYYIPSFNKFRAPSMALALIQFAFPILAAFGINSLIKLKSENQELLKKMVKYLLIFSVSFLVLGFLYRLGFEDNYKESVKSSQQISNTVSRMPAQMQGQIEADFADFIWTEMISDWHVTSFILLIATLLFWAYSQNKLKLSSMLVILALLVIFDMWRVAYRPMHVAEKDMKSIVFGQKDWVNFIKQDKEKFRIADFVSPTPNASAYWLLENVNGYHAAKLRVYQDVLDVTSGGSTSQMTNPFMWNLLNVKYIIYNQEIPGMRTVFKSQQTGAAVLLNPSYLPRAYFVDSYEVKKPLDILNSMKFEPGTVENFNPKELVYFEKDINQKIDIPDETSKVEILEYKNQYIKLKVNASGNNLLNLSEIYYPKWHAYLDNKEIQIYKSNYAFRSIVVPKGEHILELKYESPKFETGKTASLVTNILLILALIFTFFMNKKKGKSES